jgi:hypothetical protein
MVTGDQVFVIMLGSAIPFHVKTTKPQGIVTMASSTRLCVLPDPEPRPVRLTPVNHLQMPLLLATCLDGPKTALELLTRAQEAKIKRIHWRLQRLVEGGFLVLTDTTDERTYSLTPKGRKMLQGFLLNFPNRSFRARVVTPQSFDKIVVHHKDGSTREITHFDTLVLLMLELETHRETIQAYSNEKLAQQIEYITTRIQQRKEQRPELLRGWRGLARTLYLEKHRWLLTEEQARRHQS